jgi:hypothetical protein
MEKRGYCQSDEDLKELLRIENLVFDNTITAI